MYKDFTTYKQLVFTNITEQTPGGDVIRSILRTKSPELSVVKTVADLGPTLRSPDPSFHPLTRSNRSQDCKEPQLSFVKTPVVTPGLISGCRGGALTPFSIFFIKSQDPHWVIRHSYCWTAFLFLLCCPLRIGLGGNPDHSVLKLQDSSDSI